MTSSRLEGLELRVAATLVHYQRQWSSGEERGLFERSSQAKQAKAIDKRLAGVGEEVLEKDRINLAHLAELKTPSIVVEELEDNSSESEDMEKASEKELEPVGI
jgi:hypothetical protein